jgi:hypothetical protein
VDYRTGMTRELKTVETTRTAACLPLFPKHLPNVFFQPQVEVELMSMVVMVRLDGVRGVRGSRSEAVVVDSIPGAGWAADVAMSRNTLVCPTSASLRTPWPCVSVCQDDLLRRTWWRLKSSWPFLALRRRGNENGVGAIARPQCGRGRAENGGFNGIAGWRSHDDKRLRVCASRGG